MASAIRTYNRTNPAIDGKIEGQDVFRQCLNHEEGHLKVFQAIANVPVKQALLHNIRWV